MPNPKPNLIIEIALLLVVATLWGASYTFIKIGIQTIPPITFIAGRTIIAGAVLLLILRMRGISLPRDVETWKKFMFQACINSVLPFTFVAWAEQYVDASLAVILNSSSPIFAFLLALILSHWQKSYIQSATKLKFFGVVTGMLGLCIVVGFQAFNDIGQQLIPQIALVVAAICYAGAAHFGRQFQNLDSMIPATGSLICGAIILLPFSLVIDQPWTLHPSQGSILALFYLALFSTALAFVIIFRLFRTLGPVATTSQAFLRVPFGVMISAYILNETLSTNVWIGLIFVVIGVAAMTIPASLFSRFLPSRKYN
jgi:drug/metabolite transporter (DMT)-like permease